MTNNAITCFKFNKNHRFQIDIVCVQIYRNALGKKDSK